ncbi:MAG: hypothetical protein V7707_03035 [Motiliproteus sp.]
MKKNPKELAALNTSAEQSSKRKLIKGLAATPVVLALAHRPAFGQVCSLSGFGSLTAGTHLSSTARHEVEACNTFSHGGWKTVLNGDPDWGLVDPTTPFVSFGSIFGTSNPPVLQKNKWAITKQSKVDEANTAAAAFGTTYIPTPVGGDPVLYEVLRKGDELTREIVNGYLNALLSQTINQPFFSPEQIIDLWNFRQASTDSGVLVPASPMSDSQLVDLLKNSYH